MVPIRTPSVPDQVDTAAELRAPVVRVQAQAFCPACLAPMVAARGQYRCSRCHFTYCEGCEGGAGANDDA